ncbi:hypothetical protein Ddye_023934 [Dipteronia dyeriana]|uniref:Transposase MuDR plant domain-containing protein n=1 Tax=Dipteronia dyeriana TaxID=168575 RepID=A0AAD9TUH5_9ROSI|nr:hypothetical protein Ddye_023934 [Dipteronia dyeriana]
MVALASNIGARYWALMARRTYGVMGKQGLCVARNMDATKLVIYHGGSWVGNCYEGGMTKLVNVPICVSYDALVKLVEDVAKVDVARYNLQLWPLAFKLEIIPGVERYSFEPISLEEACSDDGRLYKSRIFQCKKYLKRTLNMYALNDGFEVWIRRSSKTHYEARCKDDECEFQLHGIKMQKGENWVVRMFVKDHKCNIDGFHAHLRQANSWTVGELLAPKLQVGRNASGTWTTIVVFKGFEGKGSCRGICFWSSRRIIQIVACLLSSIGRSKSRDYYGVENKCCKSV